MKKIFLTSLILITTSLSFAQITTVNRTVDSVKVESIIYDSTKNWIGAKDVISYIGQTVYVAEDNKSVREYGYDGFYSEKDPTYIEKARYGNPAPKSKFNTRFEDLNGKYFIIKETHKDKYHNLFGNWWFLLQDKNDPDVCVWFKYSEEYEHCWPFVILSHFEYSKEEYLGKSYVATASKRKAITDWEREEYGDIVEFCSVGRKDINTNEVIQFTLGESWQCYDVSIVDGNLSLLVKNKNGNVSNIDISKLNERNGRFNVFEQSQYDIFLRKFGQKYMYLILQGKISVGMTAEMLKLSWGEPKNINRSSYGDDQWVYDDQYVYLKNGVITAWN